MSATPHLVRLDGLQAKPQYNHHIAEVLDLPANPGRKIVKILSNNEQMSVKDEACNELPRVSSGGEVLSHDVRASENDVLEAASRLIEVPEVVDHMMSFLKLQPVKMENVRCVGAVSSDTRDPRCSPANSLDPSASNWWISADGETPIGRGAAWIEYDVGDAAPVSIRALHMKLPALPAGPLSVRKFHLEATNDPPAAAGPRNWTKASADLTTLDVNTEQSIAIHPPIESKRYVRIICKVNAAAYWAEDHKARGTPAAGLIDDSHIPSNIGFYAVRFS